MKTLSIIVAVIIIIGLLAFMLLKSKKASPKNDSADTANAKAIQSKENPYLGLRKQMLSLTAEQLQLKLSEDKETAYGAILEIERGGGVATIIALSTGDASMYTSAGGGIIGGIKHETVRNAAINFVKESQNYLDKMPVDTTTDLPSSKHMKFFILTNKHRYAIEAPEAEVTSVDGKWHGLFDKGNDLITQLRLTTAQ